LFYSPAGVWEAKNVFAAKMSRSYSGALKSIWRKVEDNIQIWCSVPNIIWSKVEDQTCSNSPSIFFVLQSSWCVGEQNIFAAKISRVYCRVLKSIWRKVENKTSSSKSLSICFLFTA